MVCSNPQHKMLNNGISQKGLAPKPPPQENTHTTDAVHPFFVGYRHQLADGETSTSDDLRYFCKECDVYFPMGFHSIVEHFEKRTHFPVDSCVYCSGPVCEYFYNKTRNIYHNCPPSTGHQSSSQGSVIGNLRNKVNSCEIS